VQGPAAVNIDDAAEVHALGAEQQPARAGEVYGPAARRCRVRTVREAALARSDPVQQLRQHLNAPLLCRDGRQQCLPLSHDREDPLLPQRRRRVALHRVQGRSRHTMTLLYTCCFRRLLTLFLAVLLFDPTDLIAYLVDHECALLRGRGGQSA
jgi:hypothetical protein